MLVLEVVFASIAAVLSLLSFRTMRTIKHLGVGKSFWTPVLMSGALFLFGSVVTILYEENFSFTPYTDEVVQFSRVLALCILVVGVYSYSRKISKNLAEKFTIPQRVVKSDGEEKEVPSVAPASPTIHERLAVIEENLKREAVQECGHQFGYLQALPKDASIPDECLNCDRIVECKHSLTKTGGVKQARILKHE